MTMKRVLQTALVGCVVTSIGGSAFAETINWFTEDLTAWNDTGRNDLGDFVEPYGVFVETDFTATGGLAASPFGDGNAVRLLDLTDQDKAEIHGQLAAPVFEPFRIDFQSQNESTVDTTKAIRFRMGNNDVNITSEKRAAFSISWQADGDIGGKYSGAEDGIGDVDTKNSSPLTGVQDVTMIANGALTGTYTYDLFGETRTLDPLHYDLYIGGVLLNSSSPGDSKHDDFKNGMQFHYDKSDNEYDTSLGLQQFALFSSGTSDTGPDVYFDNIIFRTGDDIGNLVPEPSSLLALICGVAFTASASRRRCS
ncbi:hypothetical protein MalM25_07960 [Planctomycetes bacterium MalM25]|nr:hypothetical protein MalM25_07960 [Planctomycetes bacterium MalM25]